MTASAFSEHRNYAAAGPELDRAVAVYASGACASDACGADEVRIAHHNRIVAWLNALRAAEARRALEDAERSGLRFPRLQAVLADLGSASP